jgi:hypothetical protein
MLPQQAHRGNFTNFIVRPCKVRYASHSKELTVLICHIFSFFRLVSNPHLLCLRPKFYSGTLRFHYMILSILKSEGIYPQSASEYAIPAKV